MKLLSLAKVVALISAVALAAQVRADALLQRVTVYGNATDFIVGAIPNSSCYMNANNAQWVSQTGLISPGTAWTAGVNPGGGANSLDPTVLLTSPLLKNASARGTIGASYLGAIFEVNSNVSNGFGVTIWGPTLDNYGLVGATDFTWTIQASYDGTNYTTVASSTGEVNNYIVPGNPLKIYVFINPNTSTNGVVLAQVTSQTNP